MARRRAGRAIALFGQYYPASGLFHRPLQTAGGRNRAGDGLENERRAAAGLQCRTLGRGPPAGHHRAQFRAGNAASQSAGSAGSLAADGYLRCGRRGLPAHGRAGQSLRYYPGAGQGRTGGRRAVARGYPRHPHPDGKGARNRGRNARRDHPMRQAGALLRAMDPRAGRDHRSQRAFGLGRTSIYGDRTLWRALRFADPARSRPADLLEGRGRRHGHGRL